MADGTRSNVIKCKKCDIIFIINTIIAILGVWKVYVCIMGGKVQNKIKVGIGCVGGGGWLVNFGCWHEKMIWPHLLFELVFFGKQHRIHNFDLYSNS